MQVVLVWVVLAVTSVADANPAERAKQIVSSQIGVIRDREKLSATFAPDAVVVVPDMGAMKANNLEQFHVAFSGSFHAGIKSAKIAALTAGGNDKVVWIAAELDIVIEGLAGPIGGDKPKIYTRNEKLRLTELAVAQGGKWSVVAAQFSRLDSLKRSKDALSEIEPPTAKGQLSIWAASPKLLAGALANKPTTFVFGTDKAERGIGGGAAKKLVESWATLPFALEGTPREVRTPTYGFVQANINWAKPGGDPYRMRVLVIGIPDSGGAWEIVGVHYGAP